MDLLQRLIDLENRHELLLNNTILVNDRVTSLSIASANGVKSTIESTDIMQKSFKEIFERLDEIELRVSKLEMKM